MILLMVGTQFPFDRLVEAVDKAAGNGLVDGDIFAQIGDTLYRPHNFEYVKTFEKSDFDRWIEKASGIISHAGMGTIAIAFEYKKRLLVMPRLKKYGEVVNDHQLAITRKFEGLGYLLAAYKAEDLPAKIQELKSFVPRPRRNRAKAVTERISRFLTQINTGG